MGNIINNNNNHSQQQQQQQRIYSPPPPIIHQQQQQQQHLNNNYNQYHHNHHPPQQQQQQISLSSIYSKMNQISLELNNDENDNEFNYISFFRTITKEILANPDDFDEDEESVSSDNAEEDD